MARTGIVHDSGDFEYGDLTGFYTTNNHNTPEVVSRASYPIRRGVYSMRAYLHRTESEHSFRTMVTVQDDPEGEPETQDEFNFTIGDEYWIGFSIYVQSDLVSDPVGLSDVVFQVHGSPDDGEDSRNPMIALVVDTQDEGGLVNYWRIWRLWDTREMTEGGVEYTEWYEMMLAMGDDVGRWTDWVFHIIFDYANNGDGLLEVWRNGTQVLDVSGGNCYNDVIGPYPTFGVYKWPWIDETETNSTWRLFYFDEFRIGDDTASYDDVRPGALPGVITMTI